MTPMLTAALLGVGTATGILLLVRRDRLHGRYALWWLFVAAISLVIGIHPQLVDQLGGWFGVKYPPTLIVMLVLAALLLKLLVADIDITRRERRIRRLLQKTAILESELRDLRIEVQKLSQLASAASDTERAEADTTRRAG